jgi:hypothetical protein
MNYATAQALHGLTIEEWDLGESVCVYEWRDTYQSTQALRARNTGPTRSRAQEGLGSHAAGLALVGGDVFNARLDEAQA